MRKTGRAKLEGSPGGRESGRMEEERSRPANIKNVISLSALFEIGFTQGRRVVSGTVGIKYPKLLLIRLPVNPNYCLFSAFMDMRIASLLPFFCPTTLNSEECILLRNNKPNIMQLPRSHWCCKVCSSSTNRRAEVDFAIRAEPGLAC